MHRPTRLKVTDLNPHFTCVLCDGYLIDATTIVECLHSFCRTCIVRYLENSKFCPVCDVQVHKTKPLLSIRSDQTLQDIVYKLVPNLYQNEMQRRKEFYAEHPEAAANCSSEERGEGGEQRFFYAPDEKISLSLQYLSCNKSSTEESDTESKDCPVRHLYCPAAFTVAHLKKFICLKFGLPPGYRIDIIHADHILRDEYTLMDIAYIYAWRRAGPMKFYYRISKRLKRSLPADEPIIEVPDKQDQNESSNVVCDSSESFLTTTTDEPEKMDIDEPASSVADSEELNKDSSKQAEKEIVDVAPEASVKDQQAMDTTDPVSNSSSDVVETSVAKSVVEPVSYNAVKVVTSPENTVLSTANGMRLKFIHHPELDPKIQAKKSGGKRGRRSTRHKSAPIRLARLAPAPYLNKSAVSAACLTTQPVTHLSPITMGKLVPSVITSLAPTLVTTLVSTTADSVRNATHNSVTLPSGACSTACGVTVTSGGSFYSASNGLTGSCASQSSSLVSSALTVPSLTEVSTMSSSLSSSSLLSSQSALVPVSHPPISVSLPVSVLSSDASVKEPVKQSDASPSVLSSSTECATPSTSSSSYVQTTSAESSVSVSAPASAALTTVSSSTALTDVTITTATSFNTSVSSAPASKTPDVLENSKPSEDVNMTNSSKSSSKDADSKTNPPHSVVELNSVGTPHGESVDSCMKDQVFCDSYPVDKKSESFKMSVKNSISAEFSDNDDLGCPPDLVVDEQKMDSSDNEDDADAALRKKITAIAEKDDEADATDDTEADSGRASDISSQARSSCDDDLGSPMPVAPTPDSDKNIATSTSSSESSALPLSVSTSSTTAVTTTSSSKPLIISIEENHRNAKSSKINHVINNLINRQERKDNIGALDLSTCGRKSGEAPSTRPKPVANPVLDIKHRQQTYLPAPNKQHTACPPAPKHPTSSMLLQGFPTHHHGLLPSQLMHGKSSHLPVPFHGSSLSFTSPGRAVSSPSSSVSGKCTPTFTVSHSMGASVPSAHQGMSPLLPGILPYGAAMMNSFSGRSSVPPIPLPGRSPPSSSQLKAILTSSQPAVSSKSPQNSISHSDKTPTSHHRKSSSNNDSRKSPTTLNSRNSSMSSSLAAPVSHTKTSMNPHHRSASPAPLSKSTPPSYKVSSSSASAFKKSDNFKTYSRFKGSNLTVYNPNPNNSYCQKLVIKKV